MTSSPAASIVFTQLVGALRWVDGHTHLGIMSPVVYLVHFFICRNRDQFLVTSIILEYKCHVKAHFQRWPQIAPTS